jgi:hypothetical protein
VRTSLCLLSLVMMILGKRFPLPPASGRSFIEVSSQQDSVK